MIDQRRALDYADRLADGDSDVDALRWIQQALATWRRNKASIPTDQCANLPTTSAAYSLADRNRWLERAAMLIDAEDSKDGAKQLAKHYQVFLTRGTWHVWRDSSEPPEGASALRAALFRVARAHNGRSLGHKQIRRIVGHIWDKTWPAIGGTIEPHQPTLE